MGRGNKIEVQYFFIFFKSTFVDGYGQNGLLTFCSTHFTQKQSPAQIISEESVIEAKVRNRDWIH